MRDRFDPILDNLRSSDVRVVDLIGTDPVVEELRSLEPFVAEFVMDFVIFDFEAGREMEAQEFQSRLDKFRKSNIKNLRDIGQYNDAETMNKLNCEAVAVIFRTFIGQAMPGIEITDDILVALKKSSSGALAKTILTATEAAKLDGSSGRYAEV